MIKKVENTIESYNKQGRNIDYINRVLASFAEIYNYDYTKSALLEEGSLWNEKETTIRKEGITGRIRAYFNNGMNKEDNITKMFYNETTMDKVQKEEYGFLSIGQLDTAFMADMIAMAVRIIEAFGIHHVTVNLKVDSSWKEDLFRYLDCLDIDYQEKDLSKKDYDKLVFEIGKENTNGKMVNLIEGGSLKEKTKAMSGTVVEAFGFSGDINQLLTTALDIGNMKNDEKALDIVVTYDTELEKEHTLYLVQELRLNGFKTEIAKNSSQENLKENYNAKYSISIKEEDIENDEVELVDLDTKEKTKVKEMDLINHLDIKF